MQKGTRQVKVESGYFTEVATRMKSGWHFVVAFSADLEKTMVRLGGEGHHTMVTPIDTPSEWEGLRSYEQPKYQEADTENRFAYLLTAGLAEARIGVPIYGVYPQSWQEMLATHRPAGRVAVQYCTSVPHPKDGSRLVPSWP